jgi:hypothetical protein
MRSFLPTVLPLLAALTLAGCDTLSTSAKPPSGPEAKKPKVHVTARFLSYRDIQDFAEKHLDLNQRLLAVAPTMAYRPGQSKADVIPLVADAAGLAAQAIVDWIGKGLEAEAKKHAAQFAAFVQQPDWWYGAAPDIAAVELTRTKGEGAAAETTFQAIVILRPVFTTPPPHTRPVAFQLVPVYLLETTPAAEDFGQTMGAVLSLKLEGSWVSDKGVPANAVLATYTLTIKKYTEGQPVLISTSADAGSDEDDPAKAAEIKLADASHYFAMPERPATLGATFGIAETDPSKWVGLIEKLGEAITGQASGAGTAVKGKLTPSS